eukprot:TRINITY_DN8100_c0_g1_i1.p1 TRINITY_DN8100_c0_g1~~TRINITY_DN8100_c0_g1_i1.p1  ORF type:complete len:339 (-),score=73.61 TRINITY_DN8100_c0_g1_i1:78-1094(-)
MVLYWEDRKKKKNDALLVVLVYLVVAIGWKQHPLGAEGRLSGHKLPYFPPEFKATVQVLDHKVVRSVDRVSHRVRIDNLQENTTTLILAAKNEMFVFNHEECHRTPFLGRLDKFMDSIPENTTYQTRAKAQTFMCEMWRYRDSQHCINYYLTYDIKYTQKQSPFSLQEGGTNNDVAAEPSISIVLPKLKEPLPPITLVQITVHPSERCSDKPLRTIDFFDFVAVKHESHTFEPPSHCAVHKRGTNTLSVLKTQTISFAARRPPSPSDASSAPPPESYDLSLGSSSSSTSSTSSTTITTPTPTPSSSSSSSSSSSTSSSSFLQDSSTEPIPTTFQSLGS